MSVDYVAELNICVNIDTTVDIDLYNDQKPFSYHSITKFKQEIQRLFLYRIFRHITP